MAGRIARLEQLGQSVWLDYIRRGHLVSGEFDRLVRERGVVGVTSNPTIFHQAITQGTDYDEALSRLAPRRLDADALFDALAIEDIQMACDRLRPVFERTGGRDGRVSIEVSPRLAHDALGTLEEARRLHREVARPNVMVKIPATAEGLPAIRAAIADGICINVTLIFSLARYEQVMEAYLSGLEDRVGQHEPLEAIHSVASFFVSRVDSKVDAAIERVIETLPASDPRRAELASLRGQAAVANARLAYARFREVFASARAAALIGRGARLQRPLWASTSTKNPAYRDTLYVDDLIGPDTVNTMPLATLEAFDDHGAPETRITSDLEQARALFERLPRLGVEVERLIGELEGEGVAAFARSYDQLLAALAAKAPARRDSPASRLELAIGEASPAVAARLERFEREGFMRRLWARDATLWSAEAVHQQVARTRLGWLGSPAALRAEIPSLEAFAREVVAEGFTHAVLLGMGGSSLAPEVLRLTFGVAPQGLDLTVLDSTSPAAVRAVSATHDPMKTLFLVSSKSGGTLEVASFEAHFHGWVSAARGATAGRAFVAITDPGTPLEALAAARGYRRTFLNAPDIGGRYSALSYFGLVPAALLGVPLEGLLEAAAEEAEASGPDAEVTSNHGLVLGAALGELAARGRDKVTLVLGAEVAALGSWIEQLVAESTGKEGRGLIPITDESLGAPDAYANDRVFVAWSVEALPRETESRLAALELAGHPVLRARDGELASLGAAFLRWEIATVAASAILGVDPFDEPNVTEAKQATQEMLSLARSGGGDSMRPQVEDTFGRTVFAPAALAEQLRPTIGGRRDAAAWAAALLGLARPGDYVAFLAYMRRTPERDQRFARLRLAVRGATRLATTLGYGPRFLHSTGQLHKGGPNHAVFIQLTADEGEDVSIPGQDFGFSRLIEAQAAGDYRVLERRQRRVVRIHLGVNPEPALDDLVEAVTAAPV